jgi:ADP-ribose pyrophosphatase
VYEERSCEINKPFSGRVFSVEVHSVTLPNGHESRREIVRHYGGACVLALDSSFNVAMVHQYRKAFERDLVEIPAGKLEPGEDPLSCARRELAEETGLTANVIEHLITFYPSPGYSSEILTIFTATGLIKGTAQPDEGEFVFFEMIPLDDLLERVDRGEIRDAKTMIALLSTERRLKKDPAWARVIRGEADGCP